VIEPRGTLQRPTDLENGFFVERPPHDLKP
jgi:hypothetical protein